MRNDTVILAIVSLSLLCPVTAAQEAEKPTLYAEVQYMQVPDGGDELYLKVENAWKKIHAIRKEAGIVDQWLVCKVNRTEGPPADYNYTVIHVFDSWDKLKKLYPSGLLQGKLSLRDEEQEAINRTRESRKMVRTQLWELDEVAIPSRLGQTDIDKTLVLSLMKSKDAGRHMALEREVWKKIWAQAAEDGFAPIGTCGSADIRAVKTERSMRWLYTCFPKASPRRISRSSGGSNLCPKSSRTKVKKNLISCSKKLARSATFPSLKSGRLF